jgi:hypothetical protein
MSNDYKIALLLQRIVQELEPYAAQEESCLPDDTKPDFIEVGRTAYELGKRHGRDAVHYAGRLAVEALAEGKTEDAVFWKAVADHLAPRENQPTPFGIDVQESNLVLRWRRVLMRYAEMFENNRGDLTEERRAEIHSVLFRGMGSFSDFGLSRRVFGDKVEAVNKQLHALMGQLYSVFKV